jgi:hypothetical protein
MSALERREDNLTDLEKIQAMHDARRDAEA